MKIAPIGPIYPVECADLDAPDLHEMPASTAETFAAAVKRAVERDEKVVAAIGRILPRRRVVVRRAK